jgi:hypothetical protein
MKTLLALFLVLVACDRSAAGSANNPAVTPSGLSVSVAVASTSFNNFVSIQLAFTASGTGSPALVTLERVALLDAASGAELQVLSPGAPNAWNETPASGAAARMQQAPRDEMPSPGASAAQQAKMAAPAYVPWDRKIAPNKTVKVSYPLATATMPPEGSKQYRFRATIDVDGKKITVESESFVRTGDGVTFLHVRGSIHVERKLV